MRGKYYLTTSIGIIFILGYYFLRKKKRPKNIPDKDSKSDVKSKNDTEKVVISKKDAPLNYSEISIDENYKSENKIKTVKVDHCTTNADKNVELTNNSKNKITINDDLLHQNINEILPDISLIVNTNSSNDEIDLNELSKVLKVNTDLVSHEKVKNDEVYPDNDKSLNNEVVNDISKKLNDIELLNEFENKEDNTSHTNISEFANEYNEENLESSFTIGNVHDCVIYYDNISKTSELNNSIDSIKSMRKENGLDTTQSNSESLNTCFTKPSLDIIDSEVSVTKVLNSDLIDNEKLQKKDFTIIDIESDFTETLDNEILNANIEETIKSEDVDLNEILDNQISVDLPDSLNNSDNTNVSIISDICESKEVNNLECKLESSNSLNTDPIQEVLLDSISNDSGQVSDYATNIVASESNSELNSPVTSTSLSPELKLSESESPEAETHLSLAQRGANTTDQPGHYEYEFDFPSEICGRLIGKVGKNINLLKDKSGVEITIKRKPFCKAYQVICIEGALSQIDIALDLIKDKFPPLKFPEIDYSPIDNNDVENLQQTFKLPIEIGAATEVTISSVVSVNHVFVQQPNHSSFKLLEKQSLDMMACYGNTPVLLYPDALVPMLPRPIEVGTICAAPMFGEWFRALIMSVAEDSEDCEIRFIDFGGYKVMNASSLRQIRSDFTALPFQATECFLSNIAPIGDEFTEDDNIVMRNIVYGRNLQCEVVYKEDNTPYCNLYVTYPDQEALYVNKALVDSGVAQWIEF